MSDVVSVVCVGGRSIVYQLDDGSRRVVRSYPELRLGSPLLLAAGIAPDDVLTVTSPRPGVLVLQVSIEADDRLPERLAVDLPADEEADPDRSPLF
jgi:hypothetical protein